MDNIPSWVWAVLAIVAPAIVTHIIPNDRLEKWSEKTVGTFLVAIHTNRRGWLYLCLVGTIPAICRGILKAFDDAVENKKYTDLP